MSFSTNCSAGQLPFKGVHETAMAYEIVNVDPPPMSAIKPDIYPALDGIVLDCLEKDPKERCQSVAEVARDLRRLKRESSRQRVSRVTASHQVYSPSAVSAAESVPKRSSQMWKWGTIVFLLTTARGDSHISG